MRPKTERLQLLLARLTAAPRAATADEALALIENRLNRVEDELTHIPHDPKAWLADGRMYGPRSDSARRVPGHPDVTRYRSRGHNIWIARNGAIRISEVSSGATLLDLPGADGCRLELD